MIFFPEPITLTRSPGGSYVNGVYVPGTPVVSTIQANVQPLEGKDLLILPEGERDKESICLLTDVELLLVNEDTGQEADQITWQGRLFKVIKVGYFGKLIKHYESVAVNINKLRVPD